jgi:hypothetical protein
LWGNDERRGLALAPVLFAALTSEPRPTETISVSFVFPTHSPFTQSQRLPHHSSTGPFWPARSSNSIAKCSQDPTRFANKSMAGKVAFSLSLDLFAEFCELGLSL